MRPRLRRAWKFPNPRISTLSPDRTMLSNTVQTMTSDSFRGIPTASSTSPVRSGPRSSGTPSSQPRASVQPARLETPMPEVASSPIHRAPPHSLSHTSPCPCMPHRNVSRISDSVRVSRHGVGVRLDKPSHFATSYLKGQCEPPTRASVLSILWLSDRLCDRIYTLHE
jgi:hypothetical protein